MVRLFVAVEIENQAVLNRIIKAKNELLACSKGRGIKPVEDENIHLTIRFIGEVPESLLPNIYACVKEASKVKSFEMTVKGMGAFPSPARPRVVWVGVEKGAHELRRIRDLMEPCLRRHSKPDRNKFVPHITIARIKGGYDPACLRSIIEGYAEELFGESRVTAVKLKKSTLRPEGPIYTDLLTVKLTGE